MGSGNESLFMGFVSNDQDDAMPIYGKNPLKIFFPGKKAEDLETWYAALRTLALLVLFKW